MKRWIKRHSGKLTIILGSAFIGNSIWGLTDISPGGEWKIVVHVFVIAAWVTILLMYIGLIKKISAWWERD